jgi:DNA polymerase-3 subunit epsilon/CBS domain-containing protein
MALDTETTGLDPAVARIIEFGSLQISRGIVVENSARDMLINPGIAIPPKSTEVHGIKDADVAGAPAFSAAYATIRELMGARVVVGHNIGFDLAIMEAEARRSSIAWKRPRFLCVRMLGTLAAPSLASHSLDAMATWLGIEVKNRHRALGDAEVAARIFIALIPKLRQIGIGTLAEAERAAAVELAHARARVDDAQAQRVLALDALAAAEHARAAIERAIEFGESSRAELLRATAEREAWQARAAARRITVADAIARIESRSVALNNDHDPKEGTR